jgi:orotate phosphoribosyltransferase
MNSNQASCLLHYGLCQFGKIVFKNGRETPYTVRLPQFSGKNLFRVLAESAWSIDRLARFQSVHCIGIANKGIALAEAIYAYGLKLGKSVKLSIVYPRKAELYFKHADKEDTASILIDNAVTTGETATKALNIVRQFGCHPKIIIRIFDREDVGEDGLSTAERIKAINGLDVISIFRLRDIIPCLNLVERQAVLAYQLEYGTTTFKKWIGGHHVF